MLAGASVTNFTQHPDDFVDTIDEFFDPHNTSQTPVEVPLTNIQDGTAIELTPPLLSVVTSSGTASPSGAGAQRISSKQNDLVSKSKRAKNKDVDTGIDFVFSAQLAESAQSHFVTSDVLPASEESNTKRCASSSSRSRSLNAHSHETIILPARSHVSKDSLRQVLHSAPHVESSTSVLPEGSQRSSSSASPNHSPSSSTYVTCSKCTFLNKQRRTVCLMCKSALVVPKTSSSQSYSSEDSRPLQAQASTTSAAELSGTSPDSNTATALDSSFFSKLCFMITGFKSSKVTIYLLRFQLFCC